MRLYERVSALALLVGFSGCGQAPVQPEYVPHNIPQAILQAPICTPVGVEIHCTDLMWTRDSGFVDVTMSATWSVADSNLSAGLPLSSIAIAFSAGVITPVRQGNISIYVRNSYGYAAAHHSYAVDPAAPAVPLAPYLTGFVSEDDGKTPIGGVVVEITDGGDQVGKSDVTRGNGYYFIEHVSMGVPLTVRASKSGYVTSVATHPGFVDGASGVPEPRSFHFRLTKSQTH